MVAMQRIAPLLAAILLVAQSFLPSGLVLSSMRPAAARDLIIAQTSADVGGDEKLLLINPGTNATMTWSIPPGTGVSAVGAGRGAAIVGLAFDNYTDVYAIQATTTTPTKTFLGRVRDLAQVYGISPHDSAILLLTFPGRPMRLPDGLISLPQPKAWRTASALRMVAADKGGVVWYGLDAERRLWRGVLREGQEPIMKSLNYTATPYMSLLMDKTMSSLYIVEYGLTPQFIAEIDLSRGGTKKLAPFGERFFKRPPCSAALSDQGDRLYVLGPGISDNILSFDTHSLLFLHKIPWVASLGPDCLATSPDGQRLIYTDAGSLFVLDATTGRELRQIQLAKDPRTSIYPLLVVTGSGQ